MRRYLDQFHKADAAAQDIGTYRVMLTTIQLEPTSEWLDTRHRFYALRRLARSVVDHDRALRLANGCPTARNMTAGGA